MNVPISEWGTPHWSLLVMLESARVDGTASWPRLLSCNPHRHRERLDPEAEVLNFPWLPEQHDDWDRLHDLQVAALVGAVIPIDHRRATISLTDLGWNLAHQARRYRGEHGGKNNYTGFKPVLP